MREGERKIESERGGEREAARMRVKVRVDGGSEREAVRMRMKVRG